MWRGNRIEARFQAAAAKAARASSTPVVMARKRSDKARAPRWIA
jgi:hypothetical protein